MINEHARRVSGPGKRAVCGSAAAVILLGLFCSRPAAADPGETITALLRTPLPAGLELCGEEVPLEREDVAERLDIELMVALSNPVSVSLWFKRRGRHFPLIESRIREKGLPMDLRYVPVVESNLRAEAVSSARAVGPWQFMRGTGRRYGLERSSWRDDRKDWEEATGAGLTHLKDLHDELGSWPLALAAYNAGKKRVTDAMERQGEDSFYGLVLPRETERYVFKVMAVKLVMEHPERFGIDLAGARLYPPGEIVDISLNISRARLPLSVLADAGGISFRRLKALNPWMLGDTLPKGTFSLRIPAAAGDSFHGTLAQWESENREPETVYYRVRRGDTLSGIAKEHGVRLDDLCAWNSLQVRSIIRPGQRLTVRRTN